VPDNDPNAPDVPTYRSAVARAATPVTAPRGPNRFVLAGGAVVAIAVAGGLGLVWETRRPPAPTVPVAETASAPTPSEQPATPVRTEADILNEDVDTLTVAWFAPNPDILVLDFPNLTAQGQAFNRMAAFIEKRGLSRDHVPDDKELADAIREDGSTVETYYYGHDYRAADIGRFYATVDRQGLKLSKPELVLRALLTREGLLTAGADKAVISIPRKGSDPFVDASGRQSLLRHELSHGEYFTNPIFAAYVQKFWSSEMTEADRDSFRGFLDRQGYDPKNEDLMANETQAHLMNTTDRRYFNAGACGLPVARLAELRAEFLAGMPKGWLRDAMTTMTPRLPS
jgi:hypothetical protein